MDGLIHAFAMNNQKNPSKRVASVNVAADGNQPEPIRAGASLLRKLIRAKLPVWGLMMLLGLVLGAIFAPHLTPYDPFEVSAINRHQPPSLSHPFGTDFYGRDILTRILYGARISLSIAFVTIIVRAMIGIPLGLIAGYFRGRVDTIIMRITDVFLAIPEIMLALVIVAVQGPSFWAIVFALSVRGWTGFARVTRGGVLQIRELAFVEAAVASGARVHRVLLLHVLPALTSTLLVYTSLSLAWPVLMEATLSFLGLGVRPPTPTWGGMLASERAYIIRAWWTTLFPGLAIMVTILAANFLGDGLRDALDPELKSTEGG